MSFDITETQKVLCTNSNPRRELHGENNVRAIDLSFCLQGENTLLDRIQDGLRAHHYHNKALDDGQVTAPGIIVPMPNLRFPRLPLSYPFAKGEKWRGYRLIRDFGTREAHIDFTDAVLSNLHYELFEGGSCKIFWTIQYNGEELQDNELYGELSGMASEGEVYIKLLAPAELVPAKKGYRANMDDTPPPPSGTDGQGTLDQEEDESQEGAGNQVQTPESALADSHAKT